MLLKCQKCGEEKASTEFYPAYRAGYDRFCKPCRVAKHSALLTKYSRVASPEVKKTIASFKKGGA